VSEADGGPVLAGDGHGLNRAERAELERLRAEVRELHHEPPVRQRRRTGWRGPVASLLIILGCVLAPVSVLSVWTANQVSDTGRYVTNMAPLIRDPAITRTLTDKITNQVSSHLDVAAYTSSAAAALSSRGLPRAANLLRSLGPPISSAVTGFIHAQVHKIVTSPSFARTWDQANRVAHAQLVKALSGQGSRAITIKNGQVTLGLGPFIDIVRHNLAARGLTIVNRLPPINPTFELFSAKYLVKAQTGYRLINDLKIVLPILALVLLGAGVYIARGHRRALIGAGLGLAASMFVLAAGLLIVRSIYLNSVPSSRLPADAAAALFDNLVRFIRAGLRTLLVAGLVIAIGAFFTGPSVTAVRTRQAIASGARWLREHGEAAGLRTGPVGQWTYVHRRALRTGAVALAALIFVFWGRPTAAVVILIVVLLLVVLGLIELLGRPPAAVPATPAPASDVTPHDVADKVPEPR
jgi:hypothetical protein